MYKNSFLDTYKSKVLKSESYILEDKIWTFDGESPPKYKSAGMILNIL
jgi:hypothetical protein